jgi:hypothetical protein
VYRAAGSDFNPGPETFTNAGVRHDGHQTSVVSVVSVMTNTGEKTNGTGDAIASKLTRGGAPQDV